MSTFYVYASEAAAAAAGKTVNYIDVLAGADALAEAISKAASGDTIEVFGGEYNAIDFNSTANPMAPAKDLTVIGETNAKGENLVKIAGVTVGDSDFEAGRVDKSYNANLTLKNLVFTERFNLEGTSTSSEHKIVVDGCDFEGNGVIDADWDAENSGNLLGNTQRAASSNFHSQIEFTECNFRNGNINFWRNEQATPGNGAGSYTFSDCVFTNAPVSLMGGYAAYNFDGCKFNTVIDETLTTVDAFGIRVDDNAPNVNVKDCEFSFDNPDNLVAADGVKWTYIWTQQPNGNAGGSLAIKDTTITAGENVDDVDVFTTLNAAETNPTNPGVAGSTEPQPSIDINNIVADNVDLKEALAGKDNVTINNYQDATTDGEMVGEAIFTDDKGNVTEMPLNHLYVVGAGVTENPNKDTVLGVNAYNTFSEALAVAMDGATIEFYTGATGDESLKEIAFDKAGTYTIIGSAPAYVLPEITFTNATVNVEANFDTMSLIAGEGASINVIESTITADAVISAFNNGKVSITEEATVGAASVESYGEVAVAGKGSAVTAATTTILGNGVLSITDEAEYTANTLEINNFAPITAAGYEDAVEAYKEKLNDASVDANLIVDNAALTVTGGAVFGAAANEEVDTEGVFDAVANVVINKSTVEADSIALGEGSKMVVTDSVVTADITNGGTIEIAGEVVLSGAINGNLVTITDDTKLTADVTGNAILVAEANLAFADAENNVGALWITGDAKAETLTGLDIAGDLTVGAAVLEDGDDVIYETTKGGEFVVRGATDVTGAAEVMGNGKMTIAAAFTAASLYIGKEEGSTATAGKVTVSPTVNVTIAGAAEIAGTLTNDGNLTAASIQVLEDGILNVGEKGSVTTAGNANIGEDAKVTIDGTFSAAAVSIGADAKVAVNGASFEVASIVNDGDITAAGIVDEITDGEGNVTGYTQAGGNIEVTGDITNNATITVDTANISAANIINNGTMAVEGTVVEGEEISYFIGGDLTATTTFTNGAAEAEVVASLTVTDGNFTANTLVNFGTVAFEGLTGIEVTTITNSGSITVGELASFDNAITYTGAEESEFIFADGYELAAGMIDADSEGEITAEGDFTMAVGAIASETVTLNVEGDLTVTSTDIAYNTGNTVAETALFSKVIFGEEGEFVAVGDNAIEFTSITVDEAAGTETAVGYFIVNEMTEDLKTDDPDDLIATGNFEGFKITMTTDKDGVSSAKVVEVTTVLDDEAPVFNLVNAVVEGNAIVIKAKATDEETGIAQISGTYTFNEVVYAITFGEADANGIYTANVELDAAVYDDINYTITAKDYAGNKVDYSATLEVVDSTDPEITVTYDTALTNGDVYVKASASDNSGSVKEFKYQINDGDFVVVEGTSAKFYMAANGTITFIAIDNAGNETEKVITIDNIDKDAPVLTVEQSIAAVEGGSVVTITVDAEDANLDKVQYRIGTGEWQAVVDGKITITENATIEIQAIDKAGNKATDEVVVDNIVKAAAVNVYTDGIITAAANAMENVDLAGANTWMEVLDGGSVAGGTIADFAYANMTGGTAADLVVGADGYVGVGGSAELVDVVVDGGQVSAWAAVNGAEINAGNMNLKQGAVAADVTVAAGAGLHVFAGASAIDVTVNGYVGSGADGLVSGAEINEGGQLSVWGAGLVEDSVINAGGNLVLKSGAVSNGVTVNADGMLHIYAKSTAYTTTITEGANVGVGLDGTLYSGVIESDASITLYNGAILKGWFDVAGDIDFYVGKTIINDTAIVNGASFAFDLSEREADSDAMIDNIANFDGAKYYLHADEISEGIFNLAGGAEDFDSALTIVGTDTKINLDEVTSYNGYDFSLGISEENELFVKIEKTEAVIA